MSGFFLLVSFILLVGDAETRTMFALSKTVYILHMVRECLTIKYLSRASVVPVNGHPRASIVDACKDISDLTRV
jgi:hypothetical protein